MRAEGTAASETWCGAFGGTLNFTGSLNVFADLANFCNLVSKKHRVGGRCN